MIKDINFPEVTGVSVAVVKDTNEENDSVWYVHIINKNNFDLENVIVCSKGYGTIDNEKRATSTLRHLLPTLPAKSTALIEPIDPAIFLLNNEYWVSYYKGNQIYDKKFIFLPDSIVDENLIYIASLDKKGILHD